MSAVTATGRLRSLQSSGGKKLHRPMARFTRVCKNILLACRALGLGASLTTIHHMFEDELHERFGIPDDLGIVALIPIGYPKGKFGPVSRRPAEELTHFDRWGNRELAQIGS